MIPGAGAGWRSAGLAVALSCIGCGIQDPPNPTGNGRNGTGASATEPPLHPATVDPKLGDRAFAHIRNLCALGARYTGSPGWRQALDYIVNELRKVGLEPTRDRWFDEREQMVFENVVCRIPGRRADRLVIGAHHDTKKTEGHPNPDHNFPFVGANDSGSGVGLLLALAAEFATRDEPPEATLELVFFDGEESIPFDWDHDRALFGSRRYVAEWTRRTILDPKTPSIRAMVLLDMVGAKELTIDDDARSNTRLKRIIARAAGACGHERYFFRTDTDVKDDHLPFLAAGVPAVDLIDIADNPQWHTADDTIEHIGKDSLQIVGEVVLTALPEIERQFLPAPTAGGGKRE